MQSSAASSISGRYEHLQDLAKRKPIRESCGADTLGDAASTPGSIGRLKEFYLQRLAKNEPSAAARLSGNMQPPVRDEGQPQASGQHLARPTFGEKPGKDIEDLEIMCNNCFNLIRSSEASSCTGDPQACPVVQRAGTAGGGPCERPTGVVGILDLKLRKLRAALEARLADSCSAGKVNVMRHLMQLRFHLDTAARWVPGCSEIGALSDHTVQQVKQLTATSRVLAPAVYIFSKRVENVVVQKERELRKVMVQQSAPSSKPSATTNNNNEGVALDIERDALTESVADMNSIVSEMDSDCGTGYAETLVTQEGPGTDVGNVQDCNDLLSMKNEDEQRRWFYSQCLTVKLACPEKDKARARKTLISDLYSKVRAEGAPVDTWAQWIRKQLIPDPDEETDAPPAGGAVAAQPSKPAPGGGGAPAADRLREDIRTRETQLAEAMDDAAMRQDLDATLVVPRA